MTNFQKPLDNAMQICYNIYRGKGKSLRPNVIKGGDYMNFKFSDFLFICVVLILSCFGLFVIIGELLNIIFVR